MSHRNLETLIGRLATDPNLRRRFAQAPRTLLREVGEQGLELTAVETEALAALDPEALRTLARALDPRIRRAALEPETQEQGQKQGDIP